MKLPNADRAVIAPDKLSKYLLNTGHLRGGSKAKLLIRMGYRPDNPRQLEVNVRAQHLPIDVDQVVDTD